MVRTIKFWYLLLTAIAKDLFPLECYGQRFMSGRPTPHKAMSPLKFDIFLIFPNLLKSDSHLPKKLFLFHLKSSFRSQDFQIFVLTLWSCRRNGLMKHGEKDQVIFKIYDVPIWLTSDCNTHNWHLVNFSSKIMQEMRQGD